MAMWKSRKLPMRLGRAALDRIVEAVLITDARLDPPGPRIVYANAAFQAITGYGLDELTEATPRILQGPGTDRGELDRLRRALEAGEEATGELVNYRRDGGEILLDWRIGPVRDSRGRVTHFLGVMRDVTEQRRRERRRNELEALARVQQDIASGGFDLDSVRQRIADVALDLCGGEGAAVEEPDGREMVYRAVAGIARDQLGLRVPIADSISGACYRRLETLVCDDAAADDRVARDAAYALGFRSGIVVPLVQGYRCFGVLKVYAPEPGRFSEPQRVLLELVSGFLASALESAHAYRAEVSRRSRLVDSLPMLVAYIDRDGRYREVNAAHERWFGMKSEAMLGREIVDVLGEDGDAAIRPHVQAALRGEPVHYETTVAFRAGDMRHLAGEHTPDLDRDGRVRGFFAVIRDVTDLRIAYTDYLTEISNRRRLEEQGAFLIESARRYGRPLSLVLMDVDHFKSINDEHGHQAGDVVLRELARVLRTQTRDADVLARWGGEEFAILAPETAAVDAAVFGERIRAAIAEHEFGVVGRVTASFGVTEVAPGDDSMRALYTRADGALYRAKREGRNRVVRYCDGETGSVVDVEATR